MPPGPKQLTDTAQPTTAAAAQSQQSKEATPVPDGQAPTKAPLAGVNISSSAFQDTRTLMEAFTLLSKYGDEYMDENSLVGEPGSFILTK